MSATAMETKTRPWGFLLIQGIALVVIGAVFLWSPAKTRADAWMLLVTLLGIYWVIGGVLDLVHMFQDHTAWAWKLFMGVISIMAGGYILMYPVASALALPKIFVLVLGIWGVIQGTVALIMAFRSGSWAMGILGVIALLFGFILIGDYSLPGMGLTFIWVAALWAFIGGIIMIVQAFRQRSA